ncbi:Carbonyl reductase [NADPH] 1 [Hypsibius exemplaris]|uniref:carbonyl reductase (NADPH) n=1 Tax=Hypsibius exemplaris TaxID=2072580 RepID=A0A1W0WKA0_HYPEX|nr:Carbonyl reductase [NADPH] 1 [Hypsibius exemplaris]
MSERIALITGGNKGIGFAIVRALCRQLQDRGIVYLTARNEQLGLEAVKTLQGEGLNPQFLRLDLADAKSIEAARDVIREKHGGLDILVNNAAIAYNSSSKEPFSEQAENTVAIDFFGTLNVCEILFPLLRPHARVVNVSSRAGDVGKLTNSALLLRITSDDLSLEELKKTESDFVSAAQRGTHQDVGFPNTAYGMSKIGVTALSALQQRDFDKLGTDIVVNSCCPGWVNTDMSRTTTGKSIDEGADTPVYLALLPPRQETGGDQEPIPRGKFLCERNIVDWTKGFSA